jgi:hypothetical protein
MRTNTSPAEIVPSASSGTGTVSTRTSFTSRYTAARIVAGILLLASLINLE